MKPLIKSIVLATVVLAVASCMGKGEKSIYFSKDPVVFSDAAASTVITASDADVSIRFMHIFTDGEAKFFKSDKEGKSIASEESWLSAIITEGNKISIIVSENDRTEQRKGSISFASKPSVLGGELWIIQKGKASN